MLIAHILKRMYVNSSENFNGWEVTIIEQRQQIKGLWQDSPSLKPYFTQIFTEVYIDALDIVSVAFFPRARGIDNFARRNAATNRTGTAKS